MLNLDKRSATIGTSISARTERHGEDRVPAIDLTLDGIVIGETEFNRLLGDPKADECFFDPAGKRSSMVAPKFPKLAALRLKDKIEGVRVTIWLDDKAIVLDGCDLAKVALDPQEGGTVSLSCQVQCAEPGDKSLSQLFDRMGGQCTVEIVEVQGDLEAAAAA